VFGFVKRLGVDRDTVLLYEPNLSEPTKSTSSKREIYFGTGFIWRDVAVCSR
jgi:hypothetical protein